ncbi:MAG: GNAT family N-acetyltransferase [Cyclobacteriaceae bacterium]
MYVILFGIGLGNIIFLKEIDIYSLLGIGHLISALFVIGVVIRYWLDWATYISGTVKSTDREFVIDFGILLNLLLLFAYFQSPSTLAYLFLSLSILDFAWVINYVHENKLALSGKSDSKKWILEKCFGIITMILVALITRFFTPLFFLQLSLVIVGYFIVRNISFRSVKKTRGMKFRKARLDDLDQIVRIHNSNALINRLNAQKGYLLSEADADVLRGKLISKSGYFYYVATNNEEILGFVQVKKGIPQEEEEEYLSAKKQEDIDTLISTEPHWHILTVAVNEDFKGTGVGKYMYNRLFEKYPESHFTAFVVFEPTRNTGSITFHEAMGFKEVGVFVGSKEYKIKNYESRLVIRFAQ